MRIKKPVIVDREEISARHYWLFKMYSESIRMLHLEKYFLREDCGWKNSYRKFKLLDRTARLFSAASIVRYSNFF